MASMVPQPPAPPNQPTCHVCGEAIAGEPAGFGVLLWTRGDERREEKDPICEACAVALGVTVQRQIEEEDDGG